MRPKELKSFNRTGALRSPRLSADLADGALQTVPPSGTAQLIADVRIEYAKEADPAGTMPPPAPRAPRAAAQRSSLVFVDKLGERLAFERSGVRLYDALLSKYDAFGTWTGGPDREDLEQIRAEELNHFLLLRGVLEAIGGDPTAVTPSANLHGVIASGLPKVLTDPRTDLAESLEAILVAELVDNDCWENLVDLAEAVGQDELARRFSDALDEERDHLRWVRAWLGTALPNVAGSSDEPFRIRAAVREATLAELISNERSSTSRH
jgi:rubrerythrin